MLAEKKIIIVKKKFPILELLKQKLGKGKVPQSPSSPTPTPAATPGATAAAVSGPLPPLHDLYPIERKNIVLIP
jgi:hypothetical protein